MILILLGSVVLFGVIAYWLLLRHEIRKTALQQDEQDRLRLQQAAVNWPPKDQGVHATPWRNRRVS
jgi:type II secretory pathway component PulM